MSTTKTKLSMLDVETRPIQGFPAYRVGTDGSVWTCWTKVGLAPGCGSRGIMGDLWRVLKQDTNYHGYTTVVLFNSEGRARKKVHLLVLEGFVGPRPSGCYGCHTDGNKGNNALSNLRWDTPRANYGDMKRHGRAPALPRGANHRSTKLSQSAAAEIRERHTRGESLRELASCFGVHHTTIFGIVKGQWWKE